MTPAAESKKLTDFDRSCHGLAAVAWKNLLWSVVLAGFVGCGRQSSETRVEPPPQRPLRAMNNALRKGQLQEAWQYADAVLRNHADDAETIAQVAQLAHETGKPVVAAELLVQSCRAESFANEKRVQQAMIAMIGVGRLHDGMEMLEEAVEAQPQQHETRRWLYDFYIGTEDRIAGIPHGRYLVRHRKFDLELLLTLSNTERRTQDAKPLDEMTSRNPDDKRPLLGDAKQKFDQREFDPSIETLKTIVAAHEDYLPAQALLGRALAASGRFEELESWADSQTGRIETYSDYWLALGDWARAKEQPAEAARAYWEATRRDADVMESWSKLSGALQQLPSIPSQSLAGVELRASRLSKFNQLKIKFERTGNISRETAVEMARTLRDLGRLWEAEAWAAMALTLPEDDSVPAVEVRESIVAMLEKETPWQLTEGHAELGLDLSHFELPAISLVARSAPKASTPMEAASSGAESLSLINEAQQRGLTFFGRTSDTLDKPGIMLYQTLGCGGGTIDYDLDGWSDLYLAAAGGTPPGRDSEPNALMRNLAGQFADVTPFSGTGDTGFGQGVAVGDVNEDGFPDLLVLNYGPNALLINNGDGTFSNFSERLGDNGDTWSASAAIADLDGDGISDLVIVNYCAGTEPVTTTCPMKDSDVIRSCTPMMFAAAADTFLQGTPSGKLADRTQDWGAQPAVLGRGLGVVAGDFDHRRGIDVFVANDMTNNHYWSFESTDGPPRLMESAMLRGLGGDDRALAQGSMGIATGDFNRDGDIDFYVTNFDKEYNTFHEQRDAGLWRDQTSAMRLGVPTLPLVGFGTEAVDLDNDGTLELVVSNGHVDMFSRGDERSLYAHPMQIFRRNGSGTYDSVGELLSGDYLSTPHVGRALWTIDVDRDGMTDFAVTHQTEPTALLMNRSEPRGDWLELRLVGRDCSRDAIGAIVKVTSGDQSWTAAQVSGDGYLCSNERNLRIGLGNTGTETCAVRVTWPDGSTQDYPGIIRNHIWILVQHDDGAFRQR